MKTYDMRFKEGLPSLIVKEDIPSRVSRVKLPRHIFEICHNDLKLHLCMEEYVYVFALKTSGEVLGVFEIGHGTVSQCLVSPREIFIRLLLIGAANFALAHNHPSGDCQVSEQDIELTKRMKREADFMGIPLLDHLIIAGDSFSSMFDEGYLLDVHGENIYNPEKTVLA